VEKGKRERGIKARGLLVHSCDFVRKGGEGKGRFEGGKKEGRRRLVGGGSHG